jgi:hypothetical protein
VMTRKVIAKYRKATKVSSGIEDSRNVVRGGEIQI